MAVGLVLLLSPLSPPAHAMWLADQVKDGPAANDLRESYRLLEQAEESQDPAQQDALYHRGLAAADRAMKIDPNNADSQFAYFANWGRLLQRDGWMKNAFQLPKLLAYLDRALELNPNHADALASRGALYRQLPGFLGGDSKQAEVFLKKAIALDPVGSGSRLELAELYVDEGREAEAKPLVDEGFRIARTTGKQRYVRHALELYDDLELPPPPVAINAK